jgi:asparagine synthase (glutamine-hydrolysing)
MISASGMHVIIYNGEIYNHLEIRNELERSGASLFWRGHSDTETLLAAIERWGIEAALGKTTGMFAFAVWDRNERTLTLARDRLGEKPLYYGWQGDFFLFGSELKALRRHPAFDADVDRNVLAMYMRSGYIVAPYSICKNIFKLLPGTYVQLTGASVQERFQKPQKYWSLRDVVGRGSKNLFPGNDDDAVCELEGKLNAAIKVQRIADVPLGAFLSGGIDSTVVVALMQAQTSSPIKTFTIGFHETAYNEAAHAKSVAQHLGTDHTELYVTPREAMEVIPKLPLLFDEPFGDSSAIPTYLISQLARQQVTVSLSGDGGDELFAGYGRYQRAYSIWRATRRLPLFARNVLSNGFGTFVRHRPPSLMTGKTNRLARYLAAGNPAEVYQVQMSQRQDERDLVLGSACMLPLAWADPGFTRIHGHPYDMMMETDALVYLPDDILVKVDRASMGVSLEARVPMLDHHVVEFAWRLPLHMKVREREGKWLLKRMLRKYVPDLLMNRPKMGFGVPVGQWTRGPMRDWAENLLAEHRLRQDGFLNPGLVREQWSQHINGDRNGGDSLWTVLMFQAWLSSQVAG